MKMEGEILAWNDSWSEEVKRAFARAVDGIHLEVYVYLLQHNGGFIDEVARALKKAKHNVRRSLRDLEILGLVKRERHKRGRIWADYWLPKKMIRGLLRCVPGFKSFEKSQAVMPQLVELFSKYTGIPWLVEKEITWIVHRDGMMDYEERRSYIKLSDIPPNVIYTTIYSTYDGYAIEVLNEREEKIEANCDIFQHRLELFNIVVVEVPSEYVETEYVKSGYGERMTLIFRDSKRLYACKMPTEDAFLACFPYALKSDYVHKLKVSYLFERDINPVNCEVWIDRGKVVDIEMIEDNSGKVHVFSWSIKKEGHDTKFTLEGNYLLKEGYVLKLLFKLEPRYKSDYERWIKYRYARNCPHCGSIPLELVRPY